MAGAPRSRGVLLFLLHRARSLTSRGHCSQVGMGGCGQRPLQTAGHRLTHLGSRLPAWEPGGGARPSRPAQHSRRVGRGAEPHGVTGRWPGPAATAGLGCNLGVVWRSGGSTRNWSLSRLLSGCTTAPTEDQRALVLKSLSGGENSLKQGHPTKVASFLILKEDTWDKRMA